MAKRMLVDATHPEETRVAVVDGSWLSDFDFERASRKQLKGNIYLAKVIRIEPSLQAAFVEYGGNRHGFLPFSEIHPDYYRIPMADRPHDETAEDVEDISPIVAGNTEPVAHMPLDSADDPDTDYPSQTEATEMSDGPEGQLSGDGGELDHEQSHHDHDHDHHDHDGDHAHGHAPYGEAPSPNAEFGVHADSDLGLITDFGNAIIGDIPAPPGPAPVETVGGEVAEQAINEERYQRPRRQNYKIQEVVKRRQVMLIQVVKEERGNKGAALTTFLSLAGRYCVLMPNTERGGGVSRKITSHQDRRRMKDMLDQLEVPDGMAIILRTAGMEKEPAEIQRDLEYLLRMWNGIREQTLQSTAPALIYEEANLIKRSMRDLFGRDVDEVLVAGKESYMLAHEFMRTIMPDQVEKIKLYEDPIPLFFRFRVETQIDQLYNPTVQLRSGGYIVINPTEALVSIDVNSGRATRERHIEGTALKTNLEAAEEIARQLRLRDLAGLIVIDFIDMEDGRNNAAVERRLKDAMRTDRARLQIGRISLFGLLELSRQRLRPSLMEINFEKCTHCAGIGFVRSVDSAALSILRIVEEEGLKQGGGEIVLHVPTRIALYILNQKRPALNDIERRYNLQVILHSDDDLVPPDYRLERSRTNGAVEKTGPAVNTDQLFAEGEKFPPSLAESGETASAEGGEHGQNRNGGDSRRRGRFGYGRGGGRNRGGRGGDRQQNNQNGDQPYVPRPQQAAHVSNEPDGNIAPGPVTDDNDDIGNGGIAPVPHEGSATPAPGTIGPDGEQRRGRRRGRRGGRGRRPGGGNGGGNFPPRETTQPHHDNRGGRDWNRNNENPAPAAFEPAAIAIPASIHDIDTTPREPSASRPQNFEPQPQRRHDAPHSPPAERSVTPSIHIHTTPRAEPRQAISSVPYEIVDQSSDKPKGGWWKKLTGQ